MPPNAWTVDRSPSDMFIVTDWPTSDVSADRRFINSPVLFLSKNAISCRTIDENSSARRLRTIRLPWQRHNSHQLSQFWFSFYWPILPKASITTSCLHYLVPAHSCNAELLSLIRDPSMFPRILNGTKKLNDSVKEPNKFHIYETEKITHKASDAAKYIELFGSFTQDRHARRI